MKFEMAEAATNLPVQRGDGGKRSDAGRPKGSTNNGPVRGAGEMAASITLRNESRGGAGADDERRHAWAIVVRRAKRPGTVAGSCGWPVQQAIDQVASIA